MRDCESSGPAPNPGTDSSSCVSIGGNDSIGTRDFHATNKPADARYASAYSITIARYFASNTQSPQLSGPVGKNNRFSANGEWITPNSVNAAVTHSTIAARFSLRSMIDARIHAHNKLVRIKLLDNMVSVASFSCNRPSILSSVTPPAIEAGSPNN